MIKMKQPNGGGHGPKSRGMQGIRRQASRTIAAVIVLAFSAHAANAEESLANWLGNAKLLADARLRYEGVDDASKTVRANALTARARIGVQTASWNGLAALIEVDGVWNINNDFNSTRNGRTNYPVVADPQMLALNRLQLSYASPFHTTLVFGRQRILLANQRFIGNVGWRQHEQTYDAVTLANTSLPGLTATFSYVVRVNRVFGTSAPVPAAGPAAALRCDCHLFDLNYAGIPGLKLGAFAYFLDLSQRSGPPTARLATSKLSTTTVGARASFSFALSQDLSATFSGVAAHQSNYRNNPLSIDLRYWQGETGFTYAGLTGDLGYEVMQGNGTIGFSTPLATLHAFDGWADLFLTTPANGVDDFYVKGAYAIPLAAHVLHIDRVTATLVHHDFSTDIARAGIGTEWDGSLEFGYDHFELLLKYADYRGSGVGRGGFADKSINWVQMAYKY
ncbi:MAG: hypothetical protein KGJ79_12500 [Alphaproteobacteria bacterium]|nr:hypothetical protein [Alphaproteobacteria bacterium]MDE2111956.1 hypothetical protein [Alphaproteobacteria bacterium]MDE2493009.1 hypothetical protein [Alphaproteobacteria bacterium]